MNLQRKLADGWNLLMYLHAVIFMYKIFIFLPKSVSFFFFPSGNRNHNGSTFVDHDQKSAQKKN